MRGGSFDENSVYINNVEVFRPFLVRSGQQEGLSIINPDMVVGIGFSTGGYAARYGDKMSSALDITYRRPKRFEASVDASLLGAGAYIGFSNKKFAWSNGIRYKTNRYLLGTFDTNGEYDPNFLDYQTYLNWRPNSRWSFDIIGDISDNHYNFTPKDRETKFRYSGECEVVPRLLRWAGKRFVSYLLRFSEYHASLWRLYFRFSHRLSFQDG